MSQVSKKKLKQATLPFFTSSPNKRKREDDSNEEEETKSRKICDSSDIIVDLTESSRDSLNEASARVDIPKREGECSLEEPSKPEAIDGKMDILISDEPTPISNVPDEPVCDIIKMEVPASNEEFSSVDTSLLNISQQSENSQNRTEPESSPNKNPIGSQLKKLTPKQIQRKQEADAKKLEREKLKQEKEKERLERKEAKERIRQAEIEAKNEEKRQKEEKRKIKEEELRRQKEAEKKAKEDEKQRKLEEIRMKEEQEKKKQEKRVASFKNFFVPKNKTDVPKVALETSSNTVSSLFMPFQIKENMKCAPKTRVTLTLEMKEHLESVLRESMSNNECESYLVQLKSKDYKPGHSENTWPLNLNDDDDLKDDNLLRTRYRCKLLQFSENRRPAYWGTWRKRSKTVSGKTPFKCDSELEYDIDSDEEWVEEPGESLHGSDDEKESDHEYELDNEVFVPHGYLSDDEGNDENQPKKLDLLKTEFEAELQEKTFKLKSRSYGCTWIANDVEKGASDVEELLLFFRGVYNINGTPFGWKSEMENASISSAPNSQSVKMKLTTFPEQFLPDFIRLVHGNKISAKNLGTEFCAFFLAKEAGTDLSQACVKRKLKEIASWDVSKQIWYVRDEVRKEYGLEELSNVENKWDYVTSVASTVSQSKKNTKSMNAVEKSPTSNAPQPVAPTTPKHTSITKFVKVLTPEDRENQLRAIAIEKKKELSKGLMSPRVTLTDFLKHPTEASAEQSIKQPFKKRAVLFSKEKGGNWVPTGSTPSVTPAIITSPIRTMASISASRDNQVTTVDSTFGAVSETNVEMDDKTSQSEVSVTVDEEAENVLPVEMKSSEVHQDSMKTISNENERGKRSMPNVTVKEGKKYATLIPIKKMKEQNS